jgi:hypothetical protein
MRITKIKNNKTVEIPKEEQLAKYKFSWIELICNTKTGETSATGLCGMILVIVPSFMFVVLIVWYFFNMSHSTEIFEILDKLITLITLGSGLLGLRKAVATFSGGSKIVIGGKKKKKNQGLEEADEEISEDESDEEEDK